MRDGRLLVVHFPRALVVRCNKVSSRDSLFAVYLRVPSVAHKLMFEIDTHMVDTTIANMIEWFSEKITRDLVTELYNPCMVAEKTYGDEARKSRVHSSCR